jgi:hypothetical protein
MAASGRGRRSFMSERKKKRTLEELRQELDRRLAERLEQLLAPESKELEGEIQRIICHRLGHVVARKLGFRQRGYDGEWEFDPDARTEVKRFVEAEVEHFVEHDMATLLHEQTVKFATVMQTKKARLKALEMFREIFEEEIERVLRDEIEEQAPLPRSSRSSLISLARSP